MNAIRVIHPRWEEGQLVFDDAEAGLVREPFVAGADYVLALLSKRVPGCEKEFTLIFSDREFPGAQTSMGWKKSEYGGEWYTCEDVKQDGWLCPALFKYFGKAPERIWIQIKRKES